MSKTGGEDGILIRWICLLFGSAGLYAITILIIVESATASIQFVLAFVFATAIVPASASIGVSLYLSSFGDTKILHIWDMNLVTIPTVVVVLLAVYYNNLGTFVGTALALVSYIFIFGLVYDAGLRPVLGVSGGPIKAIREVMIADKSVDSMKAILSDDQLLDQLEMNQIQKMKTFGLVTGSVDIGINCFLFVLPHPKFEVKSVVLLVGYELTPFEILPSDAALHRLRSLEAQLFWFLEQITFTKPRSLDSFVLDFPKFRLTSRAPVEHALRPTQIPLRRIRRLSASTRWLLLTIIVPVVAIFILLFSGFLSPENFVVTLAPTITLIGLELFTVLYQRGQS